MIGGTVGTALALRIQAKGPFAAHLARGGTRAPFWPGTVAGVVLVGLFFGGLIAWTLLAPASAEFRAGEAALERHDDAAAERSFLQALSQDPEDDAARYNLALSIARQGRLEECLDQLAKIRDSSPLGPQARRLELKLKDTKPDPLP
jgi:hypothetical protein